MADPRPHLSFDEEYLRKVAGTLSSDGATADIRFEYLTEALAALGIDEDPYSAGEVEVGEIVDRAFEAAQKPLASPAEDVVRRLWDYLAEEDPLVSADLIFVFGGVSQGCVDMAIALAKDALAPKIMFSGRRASYSADDGPTEAERYAAATVSAGVPATSILVEKESVNTPENIAKSAALLRALGELPRSVISVSLPYHARRAALTMGAGFDWKPTIIRRPGPSAKFSRDTFFRDPNGWRYVAYEFLKLYGARRMGHF